jgi:hypothetical protein
MNRLYPAETRLKEGAIAHDSDQTGGSVPLPRVGGALSARCPQYQGTDALVSNAAEPESVARGGPVRACLSPRRTSTRATVGSVCELGRRFALLTSGQPINDTPEECRRQQHEPVAEDRWRLTRN